MSSFDKSESCSFLVGYFQDFSFVSRRQDISFDLRNEKKFTIEIDCNLLILRKSGKPLK